MHLETLSACQHFVKYNQPNILSCHRHYLRFVSSNSVEYLTTFLWLANDQLQTNYSFLDSVTSTEVWKPVVLITFHFPLKTMVRYKQIWHTTGLTCYPLFTGIVYISWFTWCKNIYLLGDPYYSNRNLFLAVRLLLHVMVSTFM